MSIADSTSSVKSPNEGPPWRPRRWWGIFILGFLVAAALLVPSPLKGRAADAGFDLLHFPAFAALTWLLLRKARRFGWSTPQAQFVCASVLFVFSGLLEGLQAFSGRSPSLHDLLANFSGVACGWLLSPRGSMPGRSTTSWMGHGGLVIVIAVVVSYAPARELNDQRLQHQEFPRLASFEHPVETRRWWRRAVRLHVDGTLVTQGVRGGRIEVRDDPSPAIVLQGFPADWSAYESLRFEARLPAESELAHQSIAISVADVNHDRDYSDVFSTGRSLRRGETQEVVVLLKQVARGSGKRPVDLRKIKLIDLQFPGCPAGVSIEIDHVRLEK